MDVACLYRLLLSFFLAQSEIQFSLVMVIDAVPTRPRLGSDCVLLQMIKRKKQARVSDIQSKEENLGLSCLRLPVFIALMILKLITISGLCSLKTLCSVCVTYDFITFVDHWYHLPSPFTAVVMGFFFSPKGHVMFPSSSCVYWITWPPSVLGPNITYFPLQSSPPRKHQGQ